MAVANDMHRGMAIIHKGQLYIVKDFTHQKPGKGGAFLQVSLKSPNTGKIINERFRSTETIEPAFIETKQMEYLYQDGEGFVFMDQKTYEQETYSREVIGDQAKFLTDNMPVRIQLHEGNPIQVTLPSSVTTEVTFTPAGEKGDTVSNTTKPATTALGFDVQVPLFIKTGDKIKLSTETGEYMGKDN